MHTKQIRWFGRDATLACDGRCTKAWGLNCRPKVEFDPDEPDDVAWLADDELGEAPADPGTYEGGHAKPAGPHDMNKWCARECERAKIFEAGEEVKVRDLSRRMYNQPWKHVPSNGEVRGASVTAQPACEASSGEAATSTVVLAGTPGRKEEA